MSKPSHNAVVVVENFEDCKLTAYRDSAGVLTIGWGTTAAVYSFKAGAKISQAKADELLAEAIDEAGASVAKLVKVPLAQYETDALTSFVYNLGAHVFAGSTLLVRLNAGDRRGAAAQFAQWVHAGGHLLNGLVARRHVEATLFTGDVIGALHLAIQHGHFPA